MQIHQLGLSGGCHWCTEGVFSVLHGMSNVRQGWVSSVPPNDSWSEAIIFNFDRQIISLEDIIKIHLHTHASTSDHSMREKYRSAIYYFNEEIKKEMIKNLEKLQVEFDQPIVTQSLPFHDFKPSPEKYQQYLQKHSFGPFCQTYIKPKIQFLLKEHSQHIDYLKTKSLQYNET